ncbi:MAG: outer membrane protein assembly factor BamD [Epsilonproteobacteria bacterium]|nr:outer membrane protein assembly factor BamD [Campylobacterota bacterium]
MRRVIIFILLILIVGGCSAVESSLEPSKYNKIDKSIKIRSLDDAIRANDLESADEIYLNMVENSKGDLHSLTPAMLKLAKAHMKNREYLLANFYLDQYIKNEGKDIDLAYYLKAKAIFKKAYEEQSGELELNRAIDALKEIKKGFAEGDYGDDIDNMIARLKAKRDNYFEQVAKFYERMGKNKAAEFYFKKIDSSN